MNKFNPRAKCPKCGWRHISAHYHEGDLYLNEGEIKRQPESILRVCGRCRFEWHELPLTVDSTRDRHARYHGEGAGCLLLVLSMPFWAAVLWGANLWGANLLEADLRGADLRGAELPDSLAGSRNIKVSLETLREWRACADLMAWVESIGGEVSVTDCFAAEGAPDDGSAVDWTLWLLWHVNPPLCHKLRAECAKRVLHLFEERFPRDKRPRKSIEAQLAYAKNPTPGNERKMKAASAGAADAACAARAAGVANAAGAADAARAKRAAWAAEAACAAWAADAARAKRAAGAADAACAARAAGVANAAGAAERAWQRKHIESALEKEESDAEHKHA